MEPARKHLTFFLLISFNYSMADGMILQLPTAESLPGKHFVLIHGACHGAWSYYKIEALLKSSGDHNVTAIDLAASGINLQQAKSLRSISHYHQPLMEFMAALPPGEKVILVGHSHGGLAISQAMEKFPDKISVAVFITAMMPGPTLNITALDKEASIGSSPMDSRFEYDDGPFSPPTTLMFGPLYLASNVYQLSPKEDWALATTLMRPLRLFKVGDRSKELVFTDNNYGRVNRVFIMSEKDELWKNDFQRWMINNNPPDEVIEISGSDHMIMMSKPEELTSSLLNIARTYNS